MATLKVQDLPKEEQEKLMAEAQAVGIRGIVAGWGVETLKNKIAEEKAKLNEQKPEENEGEVIVAGDGGVHNVPEETPATDEQKAEETPATDEQKAEETPATDEQKAEETPAADENANVEETPEENKDEQPEEKEEKEIVRNGICHICRSEVINGKCTGCGFELRV